MDMICPLHTPVCHENKRPKSEVNGDNLVKLLKSEKKYNEFIIIIIIWIN